MTAAVPEPMRQFVSNLSREIERRGLSMADVAARAEIHPGHLALILAGERMIQLDTLVKLAGALGVAPERLLEGVEWVSDGQGGGEFLSGPPAPPG